MREMIRRKAGMLCWALGIALWLPSCVGDLTTPHGFNRADELGADQTARASLESCTSADEIRIVSRAQWGARRSRSTRARHTPREITVHHTVQGLISGAAAARQVQAQHMDGNGWSDIGYHFLVDRDGTIFQGEAETRVGAHVFGNNTGNLGIAMIGSFHVEELGAGQERAVANLIHHLATKYGIPIRRSTIRGHKEQLATLCPGNVDLDAIVRLAAQGIVCGESATAPTATTGLDPIEVYWARLQDGSYKLHAIAGETTTRVEYYVDEWRIAESTRDQGSNFPARYRFSTERPERFFEVRGFDASGAPVSRGVGLLDVTEGVGVYIRQMGRDEFEVGLERAPSGVAGIELTVDGQYVVTDSVSGQQRSPRRAVRSRYSRLSERAFSLATYNTDGTSRGYLRRTFDLRGE